jgi:hypothetical protein
MPVKPKAREPGCPRCGAAYRRKSGFAVCSGCGHKPGDQHLEHPSPTGVTSWSGAPMYGRVLPHKTRYSSAVSRRATSAQSHRAGPPAQQSTATAPSPWALRPAA